MFLSETMGVYKDPHKFDKELAKVQVIATFVTTIGSVFSASGISLFVLGLATVLDSISKTGGQFSYSQIIGNFYSDFGVVIFIVGIVLLVLGIIFLPRKIDKLQ
ncbi:MAG: hypothetical protein ACRDFB_02465 [Rhabdochlamydiaceae bacterium]